MLARSWHGIPETRNVIRHPGGDETVTSWVYVGRSKIYPSFHLRYTDIPQHDGFFHKLHWVDQQLQSVASWWLQAALFHFWFPQLWEDQMKGTGSGGGNPGYPVVKPTPSISELSKFQKLKRHGKNKWSCSRWFKPCPFHPLFKRSPTTFEGVTFFIPKRAQTRRIARFTHVYPQDLVRNQLLSSLFSRDSRDNFQLFSGRWLHSKKQKTAGLLQVNTPFVPWILKKIEAKQPFCWLGPYIYP